MSNVTEEPYIVEIISQGKGMKGFITILEFFSYFSVFLPVKG